MNHIRIANNKTLRESTDTILSTIRLDSDTLVVFNDSGAAVHILGSPQGQPSFCAERVSANGASLITGFVELAPHGASEAQIWDALYRTVKKSVREARKIRK